jgi:hypothetical protein
MKSIEEIDKDIQQIVANSVWASGNAENNRIKKDVARLRELKLYVESNHSEESLYKQLESCTQVIEDCDSEVAVLKESPNSADLVKACKAKWDYKSRVTLKKNLEYLLN